MIKHKHFLPFSILILNLFCSAKEVQTQTSEQPALLIQSLEGTRLAEHQSLVDVVNRYHHITLEKRAEHHKEDALHRTSTITLGQAFLVGEIREGLIHFSDWLADEKTTPMSETEKTMEALSAYRSCKLNRINLIAQAIANGESVDARHKRLEWEYKDAQDVTKGLLHQLSKRLQQQAGQANSVAQDVTEEDARSLKNISSACISSDVAYNNAVSGSGRCPRAINAYIDLVKATTGKAPSEAAS